MGYRESKWELDKNLGFRDLELLVKMCFDTFDILIN